MGKKKKYNWVIGEDLPDIDNHSLVKLDIIEQYVSIYLKYLTKSCKQSNLKLSIIDGFSGGGLYKNNITGSPIRIKNAVQTTIKEIHAERSLSGCRPIESFEINYTFIEKDKHAYQFLKKTLKEFHYMCDKTHCVNGEFSSNLQRSINLIKNTSRAEKAIFILDQYGYMDAPINDIRKIFSNLKKAEAILTFSMDSLIDYLHENSTVLKNLGLRKEDYEKILDMRQDDNFSREKLQPKLFEGIVKASGAPYYTPFFIKSDSTNRAYWLFHFSSHPTARDEMIKLHWEKQNTFQLFGRAGLQMLVGYSSDNQTSLFEFDEFAKEASLKSLAQEIPPLIKSLQEVPFSKLRNTILNETPATIEIIKQSLDDAIQDGEIEIYSVNRKSKREKFTTIKNDDILKWKGQKQSRIIF